jgi:hypothetical protein
LGVVSMGPMERLFQVFADGALWALFRLSRVRC